MSTTAAYEGSIPREVNSAITSKARKLQPEKTGNLVVRQRVMERFQEKDLELCSITKCKLTGRGA